MLLGNLSLAQVKALAISMVEFPLCLFLFGDLGSGKTTFSRSFIQTFLNDSTAIVPSPTFSLVQTYEKDQKKLFHCDFYRLGSTFDIESLGVFESIDQSITIVEWPELCPLPKNRCEIHFFWVDEHTRSLDINHFKEK